MLLHSLSPRNLALAILLCSFWSIHSSHGSSQLWPKPTEHLSTGRLLRFQHKFSIHAEGRESGLLRKAFKRYRHSIRKHSYPAIADCSATSMQEASTMQFCTLLDDKSRIIEEVSVNVVSSDHSLGLQTNEAYTLNVSSPTTQIHAETVFGALRALETLAQLSYAVESESSLEDTSSAKEGIEASARLLAAYESGKGMLRLRSPIKLNHHHHHHHHHHKKHKHKQVVVINETNIYDKPRFVHRGLLIDTARHFLPKKIIKAQLDAMAMAKLNVLHWHIIDDQSFPYNAKGISKLSEMGAFSKSAVYTSKDVQDIVSYGRSRGIRVMPEFDTPGHVQSWGWSFPSILANCSKKAASVLDVSNNETYSVLWKVFRQAANDFPDQFVHLGGDEVDPDCWKRDPSVSKWMKEKGFANYKEVQLYHTSRVLSFGKVVGKQSVLWQEAADDKYIHKLPKDVVIQVWKWNPDLGRSTWSQKYSDEYWLSELRRISRTHRVIVSAPWYLNLAAGGDQNVWRRYWEADPLGFDGSADQKRNVIGGEACLWGEMVDKTNALQKTWPLAASIAERLWSIESDWDSKDALERLDAFRCRLVHQDIDAAPLRPGYCYPYHQT